MAAVPVVESYIRVSVSDSSGTREWSLPPTRFGLGVGNNEVVQNLTLAGNADTTVSIPSGAKAVLIRPGTSVSLSLKGSTGDGNLLTVSATAPIGADLFLTLGATPGLVLHNGSASSQSCTCVFF